MVVTDWPIRFLTQSCRNLLYTSREVYVIHPVLQHSELQEASLTTPVAIPLFEFEVALPLQYYAVNTWQQQHNAWVVV